MLTLFHSPTTRSLRVVWLLEELGLPYQVHRLKFPARYNDTDFLKLNPSGTVPALQDGDRLLTESLAICDHLAMKVPDAELVPLRGEACYIDYQKWLWFGEATLMFVVSVISRSRRAGLSDDNPLAVDTLHALAARLNDLEQRVEGHAFIACDRFTLADISCIFALYRLHEMKLAARIGPHATAYHDRLTTRPAFQRALKV